MKKYLLLKISCLSGLSVWGRTGADNGAAASLSAICTSQTRGEARDGAFLLVSKGFSEAVRLSEAGVSVEVGL